MKKVVLKFLFFLLISALHAQPTLQFVLAHSGFTDLVDISNAGDGSNRLFVVEKSGIIRIIENGSVLATPFLDHSTSVNSASGERGMLGVEFHPNYENNGYFYVNYTNLTGTTTISRFEVSASDPNIADASSEDIMLEISQPFTNHNAGDLKFSPIDHYLYIPLGDGGSSGDPDCYSQDSTSFLGKILRIDVDQNMETVPYYGIPPDNPYISYANVPDEVWAFGLRNPWKFSFDSKNGDMWIADVGQNDVEEVNLQSHTSSGGENYGWAVMEGDQCYDPDPINNDCPDGIPSCFSSSYTDPIFTYGHSFTTGGFSITGGYVYRGCKYTELYGYYLASDFVSENTWVVDSMGNATQMIDCPNGPSTYGETEEGELLLGTLSGNIYEVRETTHPETLTLTMADSPLDGKYQAALNIIIENNVTIDANAELSFICSNHLSIAEDLDIPVTAIVEVSRGLCDE